MRMCTVCSSSHLNAINHALVTQVSCRSIGAAYGVGYRSVHRHMRCLRRELRAALLDRSWVVHRPAADVPPSPYTARLEALLATLQARDAKRERLARLVEASLARYGVTL